MFIHKCVPLKYKIIVLTYTSLEACLKRLAQYCANQEMYCMKQIECMKAHKPCRNFKDDKDMLNIFEDKITDILRVNPAYHLEFATAK